MRVLAVIPARGGSKGIPKKNIINFFGKPLLHWSIDSAIASKFITDVAVSSDDDHILQIAKQNKEIIAIKRPIELAKDTSKTEPVIVHALNHLGKNNFDYIILLQPTSPLRTSEDIDLAFQRILKSKADSIISVCEEEHHPYKSFKVDDEGFLSGIINNEYPFYPRQKLPKIYRANGAIYIIKTQIFSKSESLLTNKTTFFEMSIERSVDIDKIEDIEKINSYSNDILK
ncbi:acylneuraminate cytidylyltransferase family protein [Polaribacter sp. WD7]|uniref:acylneuraminate cytidylyltransferase family protein n=1 Tax=Polaribacter sp. WD7 TaxID=2269061 RepID=UPI000DF449F0|nr:acylneuraminate cytidylyltransferase family protein [Polaribacter sp. WD7]RCS27063.1 acylneuraminate cytidylyltransferase family protein [Polaribacter sp. WD7]